MNSLLSAVLIVLLLAASGCAEIAGEPPPLPPAGPHNAAVVPRGPTDSACPNAPVAPNPCPLPPLRADQARAALAADGYRDVRRLTPVGNYWEAEAATDSGPVTLYVLGDGEVLQSPPPIGGQ